MNNHEFHHSQCLYDPGTMNRNCRSVTFYILCRRVYLADCYFSFFGVNFRIPKSNNPLTMGDLHLLIRLKKDTDKLAPSCDAASCQFDLRIMSQ